MAKEEKHWFPFYYEKFLLGTYGMSDKEVGGYIRLLIQQWDKGGIEENNPDLNKYSKVFKKFSKKEDGLYYNDKLEDVRAEQEEIRLKASKKGKNGALVRWQKYSTGNAQAQNINGTGIIQPMPDDSNKSKVKESKVNIYTPAIGNEIEQLLESLFNEQIWCETMMMQNRVKPPIFKSHLKAFLYEKNSTEELQQKSIQDLKKWFVFWIKNNPFPQPEEDATEKIEIPKNFFGK